jgi:hypothetical protein
VSTALQRASERYAQAPRELGPVLERKARGDRGCLFDLGSGLGILSTFGLLIASQMGAITFRWVYLGVGIWIVSYLAGGYAQAKSGKKRRLALETGPLVPALIIAGEPHLGQKGNRRSGRVLVVFAVSPELQPHESDRRVASLLESGLPDSAKGASADPLRKLLGDEFCFDFVPLDSALLESLDISASAERELYATRVVADPEQLEDGVLEAGAAVGLIVHLESGIAELV